MNAKKLLSVMLVCVMLLTSAFAFTGCQTPDDGKYTVGIIQLVQHQALDAATQGFKDVLTEEFGENVTFIEHNASGEPTICTTAANDLVTKNVDLILGNATAALQAAANATMSIPVLGTSITDYASALGLTNYTDGAVGGNISGATDLAPLDQQAAMIKELVPTAQKVGLLYCSAEPNSQYQATVIRAELIKLGYTDENIRDFKFTDSNDVASVSQSAASFADVLYVPTDNTAAALAPTIKANIGNDPLIAGESGICSGCGIATLSIDYYELGRITGEMAVRILKGEAKVGEMAITSVPAETITKKYNPERWEELGLGEAPDGYTALPTE